MVASCGLGANIVAVKGEKEEKAEFLKEHQDVLKALAIRQDQEDQEEIN